MQNTNSRFVVNIIPLQNVISNTSGLDATTQLSNAIGNIQQMINFDSKTINTNYLSAFTAGNSIQVTSPINLSNVGITSNNVPYAASASATTGSFSTNTNSITSVTGNTFVKLYDTNYASSPAISMGVLNKQVFQIGGTGNALFYDSTKVATEFRISSVKLYADLANISSVVVGGTCYAQHFTQLSDERSKYDIQMISDISSITKNLQKINPYTFKYKGGETKEIGLLAQELEGLFPECIDTDKDIKYVKYNSVIALLLGAVRSLSERIDALESGLG